MKHSESIGQLATALANAQSEFPEIPKTKEGKVEGQGKGGNNYSFSYKYADLGDVVPKIVPVLFKHGLSYSQLPDVNERGEDGLTTVLLHESGEWLSGFMRLYLAKTTSQGHGSAITYARRYALCSVLGIVADEDDDGAVASQQQRSYGSPGGNAKRSGAATESNKRPPKQSTSVQGGNLQTLMLKELQGGQRPAFLAWFAKNLPNERITDVSVGVRGTVEKAINSFACGEVPADMTEPF